MTEEQTLALLLQLEQNNKIIATLLGGQPNLAIPCPPVSQQNKTEEKVTKSKEWDQIKLLFDIGKSSNDINCFYHINEIIQYKFEDTELTIALNLLTEILQQQADIPKVVKDNNLLNRFKRLIEDILKSPPKHLKNFNIDPGIKKPIEDICLNNNLKLYHITNKKAYIVSESEIDLNKYQLTKDLFKNIPIQIVIWYENYIDPPRRELINIKGKQAILNDYTKSKLYIIGKKYQQIIDSIKTEQEFIKMLLRVKQEIDKIPDQNLLEFFAFAYYVIFTPYGQTCSLETLQDSLDIISESHLFKS